MSWLKSTYRCYVSARWASRYAGTDVKRNYDEIIIWLEKRNKVAGITCFFYNSRLGFRFKYHTEVGGKNVYLTELYAEPGTTYDYLEEQSNRWA